MKFQLSFTKNEMLDYNSKRNDFENWIPCISNQKCLFFGLITEKIFGYKLKHIGKWIEGKSLG